MIGKVGHFNLLEEAAGGGLCRAYRARDTVHGRTVLIKVAPAELAEPGSRRERFLAAARKAASLSHLNLATIFDVGDGGDAPYLAIELVQGETLGQLMVAGLQHVRAAVDLGIQLADAHPLDPELARTQVSSDGHLQDIDDTGGLGDSERQLLKALVQRVLPGATR